MHLEICDHLGEIFSVEKVSMDKIGIEEQDPISLVGVGHFHILYNDLRVRNSKKIELVKNSNAVKDFHIPDNIMPNKNKGWLC